MRKTITDPVTTRDITWQIEDACPVATMPISAAIEGRNLARWWLHKEHWSQVVKWGDNYNIAAPLKYACNWVIHRIVAATGVHTATLPVLFNLPYELAGPYSEYIVPEMHQGPSIAAASNTGDCLYASLSEGTSGPSQYMRFYSFPTGFTSAIWPQASPHYVRTDLAPITDITDGLTVIGSKAPVTDGAWTDATRRITQTDAFLNYTFVAGDVFEVTSGATAGRYTVNSKISKDVIDLAVGQDINGGDGDIASGVVGKLKSPVATFYYCNLLACKTAPTAVTTAAAWTDAGRTLTETGAFAAYTAKAGDVLTITAGTPATAGRYVISSRTNDDTIVLASDINATNDNATGVVASHLNERLIVMGSTLTADGRAHASLHYMDDGTAGVAVGTVLRQTLAVDGTTDDNHPGTCTVARMYVSDDGDATAAGHSLYVALVTGSYFNRGIAVLVSRDRGVNWYALQTYKPNFILNTAYPTIDETNGGGLVQVLKPAPSPIGPYTWEELRTQSSSLACVLLDGGTYCFAPSCITASASAPFKVFVAVTISHNNAYAPNTETNATYKTMRRIFGIDLTDWVADGSSDPVLTRHDNDAFKEWCDFEPGLVMRVVDANTLRVAVPVVTAPKFSSQNPRSFQRLDTYDMNLTTNELTAVATVDLPDDGCPFSFRMLDDNQDLLTAAYHTGGYGHGQSYYGVEAIPGTTEMLLARSDQRWPRTDQIVHFGGFAIEDL